MFVAIVCSDLEKTEIVKHYLTFSGAVKDDVVRAALAARREAESKNYGPYRVFIGTLTGEITRTPLEYSEVPLG